jgi:hypothetical protein
MLVWRRVSGQILCPKSANQRSKVKARVYLHRGCFQRVNVASGVTCASG